LSCIFSFLDILHISLSFSDDEDDNCHVVVVDDDYGGAGVW
jgi:hypothetical protein